MQSEGMPSIGGGLIIDGSDSQLESRLEAELTAFNSQATGFSDQRGFSVRAEDGEGALLAGLTGWTWGTCAGLNLLWVREDQRRQHWGAQLLAAAETLALDRGCRQIIVSSFTFQAPGFYRRHGYVEHGRTEGIPVAGQADVHLIKRLGPTVEPRS